MLLNRITLRATMLAPVLALLTTPGLSQTHGASSRRPAATQTLTGLSIQRLFLTSRAFAGTPRQRFAAAFSVDLGKAARIELDGCMSQSNQDPKAIDNDVDNLDAFDKSVAANETITEDQITVAYHNYNLIWKQMLACEHGRPPLAKTRLFLAQSRKAIDSSLPTRWTLAQQFGFGDGGRSEQIQLGYASAADLPFDAGSVTVQFTNTDSTSVPLTSDQFGISYSSPQPSFGASSPWALSPELAYIRTLSGTVSNSYSGSLEADYTSTKMVGGTPVASPWTLVATAAYERSEASSSVDTIAIGSGIGYQSQKYLSNYSFKAVYNFQNAVDGNGRVTLSMSDKLSKYSSLGIAADQLGNFTMVYSISFR